MLVCTQRSCVLHNRMTLSALASDREFEMLVLGNVTRLEEWDMVSHRQRQDLLDMSDLLVFDYLIDDHDRAQAKVVAIASSPSILSTR